MIIILTARAGISGRSDGKTVIQGFQCGK